MSGFWADVPPGAVVRLLDADPGLLSGLPVPAPAVVTWRPTEVMNDRAILDELERVALRLFPAWLPGAELIDGPGGLGVAAVRSMAHRQASTTADHGPFLADLAERAMRGRPTSVRFPDGIRAAGLARVIAAGSGRSQLALVVDVPTALSPSTENVLIAACERIASIGRFSVWIVGVVRSTRVRTLTFARSTDQAIPLCEIDPEIYPPLAGLPHPGSMAEQTLEAALRRQAWAAGRQWNQTYRVHTLANPVRLDLLWEAERLNVEIDGPEHHDPEHYDADRRRDVDLQLAGLAVLRFTNAAVSHDVGAVLARIERFINGRRQAAA